MLAATTTYAQTSETDPLKIYVTASRTADQSIVDTYTYNVYKVDSSSTISDTVAQSTGVTLVRSGPLGQQTSTFIRGTDSNHTLVTFNGIPIRDESTPTGADDISQHSTVGVSSVNVIKGPMGSTYGPNAVAGVINLESVVTDETYIQQSFGSNNARSTNIKLGNDFGNTIVSLSGEFTQTDGPSVYANGTEKDPFEARNGALQVETFLNNTWVINSSIISNNNSSNLDSSSADVLNYTSNWNWTNFNINATDGYTAVAYNKSKHERDYVKDTDVDNYHSTTDTVLAQHTYTTPTVSVTIGTELAKTEAQIATTTYGWVASVDENRTNKAVYTNAAYKFTDDVVITGGYRYDTNTKFQDEHTTRLGIGAHGFRASVSTGYRLPTFYEMYGSDNFGFNGNPNVNAESSLSREIGYSNDWVDLALFDIQTTNALKYTYDTSTWTSTYTNDSHKQKSYGAELALKGKWNNTSVKNATTYVIAKDGNNEEKLRRPKLTNTTSIEQQFNDLVVDVSLNYISTYKDIDGATYTTFRANEVITADTGLTYNVNESVVFYTDLNNITDEQYEMPSGYSQLGRNVMMGVKVNF